MQTLPPNQPSITRWRSTAGSSTTWKAYNQPEGTNLKNKGGSLTWAEYQQTKVGTSGEQINLSGSLDDKDKDTVVSIGLLKQDNLCDNSVEELSKCRYLRMKNDLVNAWL